MTYDFSSLQPYRALDGKTFVICVGAMKSATSWVYHYLASLPGVAVSPLKEIHFFNTKFPANALGDMRSVMLKRLRYHMDREGDPVENALCSPLLQASLDSVRMIYDDDGYFAHFARLVDDDTTILVDVTPAYAVIGPAGFDFMRAFCATQGVRLRILFLMRDPVDRLWSQLRHLQELNPEGRIAERWAEALHSPQIMARADYLGTVSDIDATFPASDVLYLFYEDLFTAPALETLCAFIGADYRPGEVGERRNRTLCDLDLPDDARAAFAQALAGQYEFCRGRFGDRVPQGWAG